MYVFKFILGSIFWSLLCLTSVVYASSAALPPQKPALILLKEYHSDLEVKGWLLSE
ncbi:hypothetical protein MNBD_GAMMA03-1985, partial [hydrothermal vent metagenome]